MPRLGVLAALGLVLLMLGAVVSRVRALFSRKMSGRTSTLTVAGDAIVLVLAVVTAVVILQDA